MATALLPAYDEPPRYTIAPQPDETTVAHNVRQSPRNRNGRYAKSWKDVTLILKDQDEEARAPVYSRGGCIDGEIDLGNLAESMVEVTVKLYGQMNLMAADCGSATCVLISDTQVLWTQDGDKRCPSILPFRVRFPQTFKDFNGKVWKLPPSFDSAFSGIPAMYAKCVYSLTISITKMRRYALASWMSSRMYNTMLDYRPRTRPQRPIVMVDSIFASIKPIPEEWQQHILKMEPRSLVGDSESNLSSIECHFIMPSVHTYSISDTVPFHIQLRGTLESLSEIIPTDSLLLNPAIADDVEGKGVDLTPTGPHALRIYIARQVHIQVKGVKRYRTYTVGTSRIWPVPPVVSHDVRSSHAEDDFCLDWQGELKCRGDVVAASFSAGLLSVKDFLVVALSPSNNRPSCLTPVQLTQPIKLVTDSWMDLDCLHPRDV